MLKKIIISFIFISAVQLAFAQHKPEEYTGKIYTDLDEALQRPADVIFLDLSKQKLKKIPEKVFQLPNLEYLILRKNKLTEIPSDISKLTKLKHIDMSKNKVEILPAALCKCLELKTIILNQNIINEISPEIGNLTNLSLLDLWGNEIDVLPEEIAKLQENLKTLDMRVIYMSFEKQEAIIDLLPETDIYFSNGCSCN